MTDPAEIARRSVQLAAYMSDNPPAVIETDSPLWHDARGLLRDSAQEIASLRTSRDYWKTNAEEASKRLSQAIIEYSARRKQAEAQIAAQDKAIAFVMRDIGSVITVAERRSDPDADHRAMLVRLRQWYSAIASLPAAPVSTTDDDLCAPVDTVPIQNDAISAKSATKQLQAMSVLGKKHAASARAEMRVCGCPYRLESVGEMVVCPHCFDREQRALLLETAYGKPTEEQIERRIEAVKDRLRHESAQADPAVAGTVDEGTSPQFAPQSSSSVPLRDPDGKTR